MLDDMEGTAAEFARPEPLPQRTWKSDAAEMDEVPPYFKRRSAGIWACLATVTVALLAAGVYGYSVLRQQNIQVSQIPGLVRVLPEFNRHLANLEHSLNSTRVDQKRLADQLEEVNAESAEALDRTHRQMNALIARTQHTLLNGVDQKASDLQSQFSQLASQQQSYQLRMVQLESQLAEARTELADARRDYSEQLAALREQQGQQSHQLAALSSSLPTRQVFFEIQKNQGVAIAPGISFKLTRTDVGHQRFDGWIEAAPGQQKVLVQNQEVRNPVMFFPSEHGKAFLLVATHVVRQGVDGFLLIPERGGAADPAIANSTKQLSQVNVPADGDSGAE